MRSGWDFIRDEVNGISEVLRKAPLDERSFSEWLEEILTLRMLRRSEIIRTSRLNQTFAYQIIVGSRRATRDKLIQLAFGMELGIDGACELLERGGVSALLPICRRDVVIAYALDRKLGVLKCDDLLWDIGERTLVTRGSACDI